MDVSGPGETMADDEDAPDRFAARRAAFRKLHERDCFVLPNPINTGTAKYLAHLGFSALATTSSGAAFARGRPDGGLTLDQVLANARDIVDATDLPVNVDFEDGHAADLGGLAENVRRCVETGAAGISIEDWSGERLYTSDEAVARMKAARAAIDTTGADVVLVGRAECYLRSSEQPLQESIRRLTAYAEAGADCLYAPGIRTAEDVAALVKALAPKPINVLAMPRRAGHPESLSIAELSDLGVRRVSVGGALAQAAWGGFIRAATALKEGRLAGFADNAGYAELSALFSAEAPTLRAEQPARSTHGVNWPK